LQSLQNVQNGNIHLQNHKPPKSCARAELQAFWKKNTTRRVGDFFCKTLYKLARGEGGLSLIMVLLNYQK